MVDHRLLRSVPETIENATDPNCPICRGFGWVCENHSDKVWDGVSTSERACRCGGAGMPCVCTGLGVGSGS